MSIDYATASLRHGGRGRQVALWRERDDADTDARRRRHDVSIWYTEYQLIKESV